jgi:hypothetical protein
VVSADAGHLGEKAQPKYKIEFSVLIFSMKGACAHQMSAAISQVNSFFCTKLE